MLLSCCFNLVITRTYLACKSTLNTSECSGSLLATCVLMCVCVLNRRHADVARYPCDQCPKAFRYASLLYSHKVTHLTSQDFYCVECDLRFKTAANLRLHLRKVRVPSPSTHNLPLPRSSLCIC